MYRNTQTSTDSVIVSSSSDSDYDSADDTESQYVHSSRSQASTVYPSSSCDSVVSYSFAPSFGSTSTSHDPHITEDDRVICVEITGECDYWDRHHDVTMGDVDDEESFHHEEVVSSQSSNDGTGSL